MTKKQWFINLAVMPPVLVLVALFATFWLIKDLITGYCCETCLYWEKNK